MPGKSKQIACPCCGHCRPLVTRKALALDRDSSGLKLWDLDPETFPIVRTQDFTGHGKGMGGVSKPYDLVMLRDMAESADPDVRNQLERIRDQVERLHSLLTRL